MIEHKTFPLSLKMVGDDGIFEGELSVYNNVDFGDDVVRPGAFTKTISEKNGVVPMLWQHDPNLPVGVNLLTDTGVALGNRGVINLEKQLGREALSDLRMWQKYGMKFGQSIGYETIKEKRLDSGVRELLEVNLWEGSLVTFGMNPLATVNSVKQLARMSRNLHTELKEGRMLSASTRERLARILDEVSTLLAAAEPEEKTPSYVEAEAVKSQDKPEGPSLIEQKLSELLTRMEVQ
jgi:HK97 family phage prohead protease